MDDTTVDDLTSRLLAYEGVDETPDIYDREQPPAYMLPNRWTPEHVGVRLIHAFKVIQTSVGRPGPKGARTAWPEIMGGWRELLDENEQWRIIQNERREKRRRKSKGPLKIDWRAYVPRDVVSALENDAAEISERRAAEPMAIDLLFAEEAIIWPARYLLGMPLGADTLQLWAFAKAFDRDVDRALAARRKRAKAKLEYARTEFDTRRNAVAREVCAWGNPLLESAETEVRREEVKSEMRRRLANTLAAKGLGKPPVMTYRDASPGKVHTRTQFDHWRKRGAAEIALRLDKAGVRVR